MKTKILAGCEIFMLFLVACSAPKKKSEEQRIITVTIEPQRYFTEAIAGDKFTVACMVPKGSSPETYDPVPKQLMELSRSEAYLRIGYIGFELSWIDRLTSNAPQIQVFDTSKGIKYIRESERTSGDFYGNGIEPHIWCSTTNAKIIADNTFNALCALDKENESYYLTRYDSLCQRIERTDSIIRHILKEGTDRTFMIYHPSLSYYARDYDLQQICIEEGGKEPSPAHLKELIKRCKTEKVSVIFIQPEFDRRNAETIAKETGTTIVPINPLSYDWEEEMIKVARELLSSFSSIKQEV
ncbi:zinc transport system substrate-binding protein [termite gut metagenome]|uniref:Zinc transport system substrate-binding protein n=1 Tax=termite gut metagenome TaxID=433724 RepID=A0A5J4RLP1_9ZZZZ